MLMNMIMMVMNATTPSRRDMQNEWKWVQISEKKTENPSTNNNSNNKQLKCVSITKSNMKGRQIELINIIISSTNIIIIVIIFIFKAIVRVIVSYWTVFAVWIYNSSAMQCATLACMVCISSSMCTNFNR